MKLVLIEETKNNFICVHPNAVVNGYAHRQILIVLDKEHMNKSRVEYFRSRMLTPTSGFIPAEKFYAYHISTMPDSIIPGSKRIFMIYCGVHFKYAKKIHEKITEELDLRIANLELY